MVTSLERSCFNVLKTPTQMFEKKSSKLAHGIWPNISTAFWNGMRQVLTHCRVSVSFFFVLVKRKSEFESFSLKDEQAPMQHTTTAGGCHQYDVCV